MSYHFSKRLDVPFDQAVSRVTEALKREGFGSPYRHRREGNDEG